MKSELWGWTCALLGLGAVWLASPWWLDASAAPIAIRL